MYTHKINKMNIVKVVREARVEDLKVGTQILYIPNHADGNIFHNDVEYGFVTSIAPSLNIVYCRYFFKNSNELRTMANSEAASIENIYIGQYCDQSEIDSIVRELGLH